MAVKMEPGDYVKLRLAKKEIEGNVIESHDKNVLLIKLKSGYNIGIPNENILDSKIIRKYREVTARSAHPPSPDGRKGKKTAKSSGYDYYEDGGGKDKKPSIGLVVTGGTIASKLDSETGGVKALTSINEFARFYPKLFERVNVKTLEIPFMAMSNDMDSANWIKIAQVVEKMLNDNEIQGVIVTHGTDTLHYTSAALSFFLRDLNKPVVLTYSQRSIDRASSDAEFNLECAVTMALSDCAEVVLLGHGSINDDFCYAFPGTKVRKLHSSRRDAFKSVNAGPTAKVWPDKLEIISGYRPRNKGKVNLDAKFSDKVALLKFYPGQSREILDFYKMRYKGLILEVFGLGQISSGEIKNSWIPKLKKMIKEGFVICGTAQTIFGRLSPKVYSAGRELEEAGVIFLEDMLSETAFVKLGWVLGHREWRGKEKVRDKMLENVAGEFNELLGE